MWGYHLALDLGKCAPQSIRCAKNIEKFSKQLVRDIDMVPYGEPQIVMFGSGNKKGYTLVQLIETSNICAHFVEETNDMYLDVFSCKSFDAEKVRGIVQFYFRPQAVNAHLFSRQAPKPELK